MVRRAGTQACHRYETYLKVTERALGHKLRRIVTVARVGGTQNLVHTHASPLTMVPVAFVFRRVILDLGVGTECKGAALAFFPSTTDQDIVQIAASGKGFGDGHGIGARRPNNFGRKILWPTNCVRFG